MLNGKRRITSVMPFMQGPLQFDFSSSSEDFLKTDDSFTIYQTRNQ